MYNIPVSISDATAQNPTVTFTAGTVVNFGSGSARGDVTAFEQTADLKPTATSSASTGGDAASQTSANNGPQAVMNLVTPAIVIGVAVLGYALIKKLF